MISENKNQAKFKKNSKSNHFGFTLAEIMIALIVMGIVVTATMGIKKSKDNFENKYMYYSAFTNLQSGVSAILNEGCSDADITASRCTTNKQLPIVANAAGNRGLCDRLSRIYNIVGSNSCSTADTNKSSATTYATIIATPLFTLTNGQIFYGFRGVDGSGTPPYTIWIDINGNKGNRALGTDVLPFNVHTDGRVFPFYSSSDATSSRGATSTDYLSATVRYRNGNVYVIVRAGRPYRDAVCDATGNYEGAACTQNATCTTNTCEVVVNKPGY